MNNKQILIDRLRGGRIAKMYANTYYSLLDRVCDDGLFPESIADGGYGHVEFCRTIGAVEALFSLTGEYAAEERVLRFTLDSSNRCGLHRIPHIAFPVDEDGCQRFSTDDEVDGTLHVLAAYAKFVLTGKASPAFENTYYDYVKNLLNIVCDMPYFYYNGQQPIDLYPMMFPPESMKLVLNCALEHSREGRRWTAFDILTQSFFGSALDSMAKVADKRGDSASAAFWRKTMELLREGVQQYLTRRLDGKTVYLEMRLPDGGWGRPFTGMGWVNFAPIAAGWQPLEPAILDNTIEAIRRRIWIEAPHTGGKRYMATEFDEKGDINHAILGKVIGWDFVYSAEKEQYGHILDWLDFLAEVNGGRLLAENLTPAETGWTQSDGGNGEQCTWWCWGMAAVRKALGLPAAPERCEMDS